MATLTAGSLRTLAAGYRRRTGGGQATVVEALACEPSWKPNEALNGNPPRGQCSGTPTPRG